jgi:hypothetical protein
LIGDAPSNDWEKIQRSLNRAMHQKHHKIFPGKNLEGDGIFELRPFRFRLQGITDG